MYVHSGSCRATLRKIICGLDKHNQRTDGRPRFLPAGSGAVIQLELERPMSVELHAQCRSMGRLVLREAGQTLAAGAVTAILL